MDIGVFLLVIASNCIDDGARLLRCSSIIEIDELFSADVARQDRKIASDFLHVKPSARRASVSAGFSRRNFRSSGHPTSSTFLPRSSLRATVESGFTELAISTRCAWINFST